LFILKKPNAQIIIFVFSNLKFIFRIDQEFFRRSSLHSSHSRIFHLNNFFFRTWWFLACFELAEASKNFFSKESKSNKFPDLLVPLFFLIFLFQDFHQTKFFRFQGVFFSQKNIWRNSTKEKLNRKSSISSFKQVVLSLFRVRKPKFWKSVPLSGYIRKTLKKIFVKCNYPFFFLLLIDFVWFCVIFFLCFFLKSDEETWRISFEGKIVEFAKKIFKDFFFNFEKISGRKFVVDFSLRKILTIWKSR